MKAIRIELTQNEASYIRKETVNNKMTYPLPPFSTIIGMIHNACGYREYHPMDISVQGDYMSLQKQLYRQYYPLNNCSDDRGTLELHPSDDIITNRSIKIAKAIARNASFRRNENIIIYNQKEYATFLSVVENKKLAADEKRKIKEEKKEYEKLQKENGIKKKEYKEYPEYIQILEKEQEANTNADETVRRYNMYRTVEYVPAYQEVLYEISLVLHIRADEDTLNDILNNVNNIQSLGRSEDFVDVKEAKIVELNQNSAGYEVKSHIYVNSKDIENFLIPANGTRYNMTKSYILEDGIRHFHNVGCIYTSNIKLLGFSDTLYVDEDDYVVSFN